MAPFQQEGERLRLEQQLSKQAIALALQGRWEEAIAVNRNIIEMFPDDVDAYNRLGKALTESGEFAQAKEAYAKALELAPNNAIAKKNLARLANLPQTRVTLNGRHHKIASELFTTEMRKAGTINLCNLAPREVLAKMGIGDQVQLSVEGQRLIVQSEDKEYLGEVEALYSLHLVKLIRGGNRYAAAIISIEENSVRVLIREVYQHPSQAGRTSFPTRITKHPAKEALVGHALTGEEDEALEEIESVEEEGEYSKEGALPEGFSLVEGADGEGGIKR